MTRKLIVTQNTTVDSVIDLAGGWFALEGPANRNDLKEMRAVEEKLRATADALLLGRRTFVEFRGYWQPNRRSNGCRRLLEPSGQVRRLVHARGAGVGGHDGSFAAMWSRRWRR
jgi:hypothetical protein